MTARGRSAPGVFNRTRRQGAGTTVAPPLRLRRPVIGRGNDYLVAPLGWAGEEGRPKVTRCWRRCGAPRTPGGGWRWDGARGERRRRVGRAHAADPQPEARAASGQWDPVPQLHFALLLPRYGPPRPAPAQCAPVAGRPLGEAEAASEWPPGSLGATPLPVLGTTPKLPSRACLLTLSSDSVLPPSPLLLVFAGITCSNLLRVLPPTS